MSPNSCCLALITSNKLCQVTECELKLFSGLKFLNLQESEIRKDLSMSKFDILCKVLRFYKENVFISENEDSVAKRNVEPSDIILFI